MLVEDSAVTALLVCCFRLLHLPSGAQIGRSYSAQFYELVGACQLRRADGGDGPFLHRPGPP
jgi:hypothetical protein